MALVGCADHANELARARLSELGLGLGAQLDRACGETMTGHHA
jgi:hypothetical protein